MYRFHKDDVVRPKYHCYSCLAYISCREKKRNHGVETKIQLIGSQSLKTYNSIKNQKVHVGNLEANYMRISVSMKDVLPKSLRDLVQL